MDIAMIGQKHFNSREGGIEVVVTELARRLAKRGHNVTCYDRSSADVMTGEKKVVSYEDWSGVKVIPVKTIDGKGLAALSSSISATIKAICQHPDVIHYHAEGPSVSLLLARLMKIKTVVTIHGLDWQCSKWGRLARSYIKLGELIAAKYADEIIVLSDQLRGYFDEKYGRVTHFIPNGVAVPQHEGLDLISDRWGLEKDGYYLYLGRIVPDKGLETLIEAYDKAHPKRPLVIAGGGSDTEDYERKIKRLAAGNEKIIFTGYVTGRAYRELFENTLSFVLPSEHEGMPMSLLEAMAYGRCCIASDIDVLVRLLDGCGLIVPVGDSTALSVALSTVEKNTVLRREFGEKARIRVEAKYDWDRVVDQTLDLYRGDGDNDND